MCYHVLQDYLTTQLQLVVESSTPKILRSRDKEGMANGYWTYVYVYVYGHQCNVQDMASIFSV